MRPRTRFCTLLALPLVLLGLAAAGCGGDSGDEGGDTTTAAAPADPAIAARAFRGLTEGLNARLTTINARIQAGAEADDWDGLAQGFDDYAATLRAAREGLQAIDFPEAVQEEADDLAASAESTRLISVSLATGARARDVDRAAVQSFATAITELSRRSTALRAALGLPPAPEPGATPGG